MKNRFAVSVIHGQITTVCRVGRVGLVLWPSSEHP
jgi:hypothetical protein